MACVTVPTTLSGPPPLTAINDWPRMVELNSNPIKSSLYHCANGNPSTDSQFSTVWQAAQKIGRTGTNNPPQFIANKFYQNIKRLYFYENLAALNLSWNTNYSEVAAGGKIYGVTLKSGDSQNPGVPVGSVGVWRKAADGTTNKPNSLKGVVYHELGHVFDSLFNYPSTLGSSNFATAKQNDIFDLNHLTRAQAFSGATIKPGCQALYNQPWDPNTQIGTPNWDVALCNWPYFTQGEEFFANIFGKRIGGLLADAAKQPDLYGFGNWLTSKFTHETDLYMDAIDWTGWAP